MIDLAAARKRPARMLCLVFTICSFWLFVYTVISQRPITNMIALNGLLGILYPVYEIELWNWIEKKEKELDELTTQ